MTGSVDNVSTLFYFLPFSLFYDVIKINYTTANFHHAFMES